MCLPLYLYYSQLYNYIHTALYCIHTYKCMYIAAIRVNSSSTSSDMILPLATSHIHSKPENNKVHS